MSSNTSVIEVNKLEKIYRGEPEPAVRQISFTIQQGDIFGILGPNGAGKTTTISALCGLIRQTSGTISVNGFDHSTNHQIVKKFIGVVPQEIALFPTLTAYENLKYFGNMYGLKGKQLKGLIENFLVRFGLSESKNKQVRYFSGGMKRRINLLAAILHRPSILFLDEPTVGVDVQSRTMIIDYLRELNSEGTTIVYTSHHMEEAQNFCKRR